MMPSPLQTKICAHCGDEWNTRSKAARTCSPKCRAQLREKERGSTKGRAPREYPVELVEKVRDMYNAGHTIREIQAQVTGVKVQNLMKRHGIESRGDGMDSHCLIIRTGQGLAWCFAARSLYIQGVNQNECTHLPDITPNWWEWNPPSETPPPARKVADIEGLVRELAGKEPEVLGQFALFAI